MCVLYKSETSPRSTPCRSLITDKKKKKTQESQSRNPQREWWAGGEISLCENRQDWFLPWEIVFIPRLKNIVAYTSVLRDFVHAYTHLLFFIKTKKLHVTLCPSIFIYHYTLAVIFTLNESFVTR